VKLGYYVDQIRFDGNHHSNSPLHMGHLAGALAPRCCRVGFAWCKGAMERFELGQEIDKNAFTAEIAQY
jgi:hypothetical protein